MIETVARAQSTDPKVRREAWAELYETYYTYVLGYILLRVHHKPQAEDLAHDVFVRALRSVDRWEWQGREFGAWLSTIARHIVADYYKSSYHRTRAAFAPEELNERIDVDRRVSPPAVLEMVELAEVLAAVLRGLTADQYEVLRLRYLEGLSIRDTALKMDRNEGAVKALAFRATRNAAQLLPDGYR